jgi:MacB-like periplasmic core domain
VRPLIGRKFLAGEDQPGTNSLVVLTESIWRRRFSANSSVLGPTILVNGTQSTVIGVMRQRNSVAAAGDGSLDQLTVESADEIRPVVLSRHRATEAWRDVRAGTSRDERHRAALGTAESVLQACDVPSTQSARCVGGNDGKACDPGAVRCSRARPFDCGGERSEPDAFAGTVSQRELVGNRDGRSANGSK